jgi:hypothetical protein
MDKTTGNWNTELVQNIFYPQDADFVLHLNALVDSKQDFVAWYYESNGVFSVKSAYKLAYDLKYDSQYWPENTTVGDNSRALWKLIWKAPVLNKVRIFGWTTASIWQQRRIKTKGSWRLIVFVICVDARRNQAFMPRLLAQSPEL